MMKMIIVLILTLLAGLAAGVLAGCLIGLLEIAILLTTTSPTAHSFLFPAVAFYSVFWSVIAMGVGVFIFLISHLIRKPIKTFRELFRWHLAILLPLSFFVIAGGHANRLFLPGYSHPRSFLFDGAFLLLNIVLGFWLFRSGIAWVGFVLKKIPAWFKITVFLLLFAGFLFKFLSPGTEPGESRSAQNESSSLPNVLWITLDALRADHLSFLGYPRKTTPQIDELARQAVVFTNGFANSSWTRSSVATMFTSLYPSTHGVNGIGTGLSSSLAILPELLHDKGYTTGIFSANAFVGPIFGYGQGVDRFHYKQASMYNELIIGHMFRSLMRYSVLIKRLNYFLEYYEFPWMKTGTSSTRAPGLRDAFLDWVKTLNNRPFFAYFHFMESHTPYDNPPPFNKMFDPDYEGPPQNNIPLFQGIWPFSDAKTLPPEKFKNVVAQYDGAAAYMDQTLGEMFQELKAQGLFEKTVIIITADHGEEFYDHEGWGHGKSLFNEVLHVPFIIYAPAVFTGPKQIDSLVSHIDLMPTVLDLAGIHPPDSLEGRSLLPLIQGVESGSRAPLYSEVIHENSYARAALEEQWKLIYVHVQDKEKYLLYDLRADPLEKNLLEAETHPEAKRLKSLLTAFTEKSARKAVRPETAEVDSETKEELRALGYLQ